MILSIFYKFVQNFVLAVLGMPRLDFKKDDEQKLRYGIIRYYMCAEVLFDEDNPKEIQNSLRNIINKQDDEGRTPLYIASKDWPCQIVESILKFGGDISIPNCQKKYPLKRPVR